MDFEMDESRIFYGLGIFLGVLSIIYFGNELILDLSPTVKSLILLSGTGLFLAVADIVEHGIVKSSFYVFSAFSYLSFLVYLFATFSLDSGQVFAVLAFSSAVFIGLGYLRSEKGYSLGAERSKKLLAGVLLVLGLLLVFDATGAQPEYTLELEDSVEVVEGEEFQVGVLEISNTFPLSRNIDVPNFGGCLSVSEDAEPRGLYINPEDTGIISGSSTERLPLNDTVSSRPDGNVSVSGNYTVKQEECSGELEEKTIYIEYTGGNGILRSVIRD